MSVFRRVFNELTGRGDASVRVPLLDGALRPNQDIEEADTVCEAEAPDNVVSYRGEVVFSSGSKILKSDGQTVLEAPAAITALAVSPDDRLAVGLDGAGVMIVAPDGAETRVCSHLENPTALLFLDDALVVANGSANNRNADWKRDLMEGGRAGLGTGSVWLSREGQETEIANGLGYPYGLALAPDGRLVVSEGWKHRLLAIDPNRPERREELYSDLPAYPARLTRAEDGGYWLAAFAPRSQMVEFVLREAGYRNRMIAEIHPDHWVAPSMKSRQSFLEPLQGGGVKQLGILKPWAPSWSYGLVIRLGEDFIPVSSHHSRADGTHHGVTSVLQDGNRLYVASRGGNKILSLHIGG